MRAKDLPSFTLALAASLGLAAIGRTAGEDASPAPVFLSDASAGLGVKHSQQWGELGVDTAAGPAGRAGSPLRLGDKTYARGLGHHANGEIAIALDGRFARFRCLAGVQWQGGKRGSVIFRVAVDGVVRFETGPLSDSDPARPVNLAVTGARELRLTASDSGDGIGCDMANWAEARLEADPDAPLFGQAALFLDGTPAPAPSASAGGFALIAHAAGPQVARMEPGGFLCVSLDPGEEVRLEVPVKNLPGTARVRVEVEGTFGGQAEAAVSVAGTQVSRRIGPGATVTLDSRPVKAGSPDRATLTLRASGAAAALRVNRLRLALDGGEHPLPLRFPDAVERFPPAVLPPLRPGLERELIEWDWRMQDGIGTTREPRSWREASRTVIERGDRLLRHLAAGDPSVAGLAPAWESLRGRWQQLATDGRAGETGWREIWRQAHSLRRRIALSHPLARTGPLLFVKHVPSSFSHQLTQYAGRCARPGGGLFVLEEPGASMRTRQLGQLPPGSYLSPDVSWDGSRILFSFCETVPGGADWRSNESQHYNLYEIAADGSGQRRLTDGACDDFSPRHLPDGRILFLCTRRGGFHRCGRGPCPVHTLAIANRDGSGVRVISFHETHEWDPTVLNDGRILYTRWDYVDRNAVFYQQLWSARPDGGDVRSFYGNNTLNPVGVWEARAVPGSHRVMATAAAHHAMTAGSIILLDTRLGIDGLPPIQRLTPDALFPESEAPVQRWHNPAGVTHPPELPPEQLRWPGHCYRTPFPLSEDFFLAAYSFEPLAGEPFANPANMFGLYLADRFGNKELLYRDPAIGSLWPLPLRPRPRPPVASPNPLPNDSSGEGTFLLQSVYASWPSLGDTGASVKRLRILQVLPKTTPHANSPRVGLAHASPGKQVLGTVPVEPDGSAYFRAPSRIPLAFQALDESGMAVQTMRSLTYLQPGERSGCVGCHEHREASPASLPPALAAGRAPSPITPGPDGSKPFSYPLLVQPVLDRHCVECHSREWPEGGIDLTGAPAGEFTESYQALARRVPFSEWHGTPQSNGEPLTMPDRFGARPSKLLQLLRKGHHGVQLSPGEWERLVTWMDTNALFYGTFDPEQQLRQLRGERIAGPALE